MSAAAVATAKDAPLNVIDRGHGYPVIFQHGLGGDRNQVADSFPDDVACRRITVECRGHGLSAPDQAGRYAIAGFADDVLAVADRLGAQRFAAGGISMGAAIALRLAVTHPQRVSALMLIRPAWLTEPSPDNMQPFAEVAGLLRQHGRSGRDLFRNSPTGLRLADEAPDNLASLLGFFDSDHPLALADLLGAIADDGPDVTERQLQALKIPVLVLGHARDLVHPLEFARSLASLIPGAHLAEVTPKAVDKARYRAELQAALRAFLNKYVISRELEP